jgi:dihydroxyacid dehydratase/phosphogluconate dehydratase
MCIGYACPEARAGGPIALVRDGDITRCCTDQQRGRKQPLASTFM